MNEKAHGEEHSVIHRSKRKMTNGQPTFKRLMWGFGVTLVYFVAGKFGLSLASVHASASAVWPPTGIAFSAFLLLGSWIWPWIFAGAFFVNITTAGSIATSLGIAAGNTLEGIVGAYLVQRYANGRDVFEQSKDIFKFVLLAGLLSTAISATIGVTSITLGGFAPWEGYRLIWLTWWLGDVVGNVVVAPLVVLWARQRRIRWNIDQAVEFVFLAGFLIAMSELAFGVWQLTPKRYPLAFLCVPPLVWTAFRFGPRETAAATALLAALAIRGTLQGMGPFGQGSLHESLLILQAFMGVNAIMALTLASVVAERRRAEKELVQARDDLEKRVEERTVQLVLTNKELQSEVSERRRAVDASKESEEKFRNLLELAPDALIMVNAEGMIQLVNSQAVKMFGYSKEELVGKPVDELLPARFRVKHQNHRQSYFLEPRVRPMGSALDLFALRHDGSEFPVEISLSPLNTGDGVIVTAALRDITDRRKSEEMIRMLAHTMTNMNECVTITDLENHIKFVNEAFLRTYGDEKDEILPQSVDILRSPHNREGLTEEIVEETLKHGWTGEILNVRRNGEEFPIRLSTSVIHDESGNPILLLGVSYDITEEKKL
ncbi:MAG: MASE1 domain-containing protein, partial [Ignavibacteriales bacterium]|nr:MASE1 domain-containing protein [Ignavibacteriales bacterium]